MRYAFASSGLCFLYITRRCIDHGLRSQNRFARAISIAKRSALSLLREIVFLPFMTTISETCPKRNNNTLLRARNFRRRILHADDSASLLQLYKCFFNYIAFDTTFYIRNFFIWSILCYIFNKNINKDLKNCMR